MPTFPRFLSTIIPATAATLFWTAATWAAPGLLRDELAALAERHHFALEGLARIGPAEPAPVAEEASPAERINSLLRDYNHLVIGRPGGIEKVLVTSRKTGDGAKSADSAYVPTVRQGIHHQVQAALVGPNAVAKTVALIVDTGASTLVLPSSMIAELGFTEGQLQDGTSQTASGTVPVKNGILRSVRVGAVSANDVRVGFIADRQLGGALLLGMSFLSRFRMTIDDARNELVLIAK